MFITEPHNNSCNKCIKFIMAIIGVWPDLFEANCDRLVTGCKTRMSGQLLHHTSDCGHMTRILGLHVYRGQAKMYHVTRHDPESAIWTVEMLKMCLHPIMYLRDVITLLNAFICWINVYTCTRNWLLHFCRGQVVYFMPRTRLPLH